MYVYTYISMYTYLYVYRNDFYKEGYYNQLINFCQWNNTKQINIILLKKSTTVILVDIHTEETEDKLLTPLWGNLWIVLEAIGLTVYIVK